jgi:perosamine synthetase
MENKMKKIKLFDPIIDQFEEKTITKILHSGFWASGTGAGQVLKFENEFKKYLKTKNCVAVNSGTAALHLALSEIDIKGKEIILPSLSFVSTANAVLYNKGIPIFVDVDKKTLCIDPKEIKKKISKKTKVIIPVHFGGMPAKIDKIKKIGKENNCIIIEDVAHACGSIFKKKRIGTHGDMCCFSFHPVKNLAMPSGGLITINTRDHLQRKKSLLEKRWCGISNRKGTNYDVKQIGWNYYMNEFSAGIGLIQLKKLDRLNRIRKNIAKRYFKEISIPEKMEYSENCVYHFFWILVNNRDEFRKKFSKAGIETGIHYQPIHKMSLYNIKTKLPITEEISKKIITLPTHPNLKKYDVDKIIKLANSIGK